MEGLISFIHRGMTPVKLSNTLADAYAAKHMTEVMVVDTHCGCLSAIFRGRHMVNFPVRWPTLTASTLSGIIVVDTN